MKARQFSCQSLLQAARPGYFCANERKGRQPKRSGGNPEKRRGRDAGQRNDGTLGYTTRGSLGEHAAMAEEKPKFNWRAPPDWMWRALAGYVRSMPVQDFQFKALGGGWRSTETVAKR
jgi:hypothetical protein